VTTFKSCFFVFIFLNYCHIASKHQGVMKFSEKLVLNRSFRLAEEDIKFTLNSLLLVFNLCKWICFMKQVKCK
jgi:hypothetical protein